MSSLIPREYMQLMRTSSRWPDVVDGLVVIMVGDDGTGLAIGQPILRSTSTSEKGSAKHPPNDLWCCSTSHGSMSVPASETCRCWVVRPLFAREVATDLFEHLIRHGSNDDRKLALT